MTSWGPKRLFRCLRSPLVIALLLPVALLFDAGGRHLVRYVTERVYTPPALTRDNVMAYNRFVRLVEAHPEHRRVFPNSWGTLHLDQTTHSLSARDTMRELERRKGFSIADVTELTAISEEFRNLDCMYVEKRSAYVAFVSRRNYMMPTRPGA